MPADLVGFVELLAGGGGEGGEVVGGVVGERVAVVAGELVEGVVAVGLV